MNKPFQQKDHESSRGETEEGNTVTSPNGGQKSNPPMVAGQGEGEAEDVKSLEAAAAKETASNPESEGSSGVDPEVSRDQNSLSGS